MITNEGLEDQLLSITIARERSQLEEERNSIVLNSAKNKKFKKERFLFP
jgi:dynein heavy chain